MKPQRYIAVFVLTGVSTSNSLGVSVSSVSVPPTVPPPPQVDVGAERMPSSREDSLDLSVDTSMDTLPQGRHTNGSYCYTNIL